MPIIKTARSQHFFPAVPSLATQQTTQAPKKKRLQNVGGQGDCGFRSLAAAMVDNIIANHRLVHVKPNRDLLRANEEFCTLLLQQHLAYFPHYNEEIGQGLWTPVERLERMRHKQGFIPDLAYTLRQLAVDEIVAHPEDYRGAFVHYAEGQDNAVKAFDQQTSPVMMRQIGTWIDESAIAAVANIFNIPVTVRVTASNQELFKPLHYGPDAQGSSLMQANELKIQLEAGHYQPMLVNPQDFESVANQSAFMQRDVNRLTSNDPSLEEMLGRIKEADKKILREFEEFHADLTERVRDGQLDKETLLAIYIQGIKKQGNSGYLEGRVRQVGLEYGHADFFECAIKNAGTTTLLTRSNPNDPLDEIIVAELVHAIARAMTIKDLSLDDVYSQIAHKSQEPSRLK